MTKKMMPVIFALGCFLVACLVGCASQKMWYGNAESGFILQHRLATTDSCATYRCQTSVSDSMYLMGKSIRANTNFTFLLNRNLVSRSENGSFRLSLDCDSIRFNSTAQNLQPILPTIREALSSFIHQKLVAEMSPLGEATVMAPIDSLLPPRIQPFLDPQAVLGFLFPKFKPEGVLPGNQWSASNEYIRKTPELNLTISDSLNYKIESVEQVDSLSVLRISVSGNVELEGKERQLNILAKVLGKGEVSGEFLFAHQKSRFLGGSFLKKFRLDYFFPGVESMPVTKSMTIHTEISSK